MRYLSVGGSNCDIFDIDAHLQGVLALDAFEQDTLAWALNERLDEVAAAAHVPYLTVGEPTSESLQEVISDLLDDGWHAPRSPHPETE